MAFDKDLPDELQTGEQDAAAPSQDQLLADLGIAVAQKRDAAVKARKESGIEEVWKACEEAYLCIDDSNRADFANAKWAKPTSMQGPVQAETTKKDSTKSSAFVRLTPRYVDAGYAKICEIILPIDDKPFSFGPSPDPELVKGQKDLSQLIDQATGQPVMRAARPDEIPADHPPGQPAPQVPVTGKEVADKLMAQAKDAAEKAETRIYDWMVECNHRAEMRKLVFDAARIGVGVLKGPFPSMQKDQALTKVKGGYALQISHRVAPATKRIDPWNFFPDGACGENVADGDYCFERDFITEGKLKKLKKERDRDGNPIYLNAQIDKILEEGPGKCKITDSNSPSVKKLSDRYEIWYMVGTLTRKDMQAANAAGLEDLPDELTDVHAVVTLVNDTVIRATINPLDSGKFGYHAVPWSRRDGHWAGVGVGEQVAMPQRMVNAGTRALLNNGGLSAGIQVIIDQSMIIPADNDWKITPNKIWYKADGAQLDDVRKAFMSVEFPNVGAAMMAIIQYGFKLAEEACNIPLISQGQVNADTPDTFGAAELQNSNANTLLRSIAYAIDDHITEPLVTEFYEWLLLDPNVPDDEKGDFKINARGSIAMVEKAIQEKTMMQAGALTANPAYGIDPKRWFAEYWKTKRLDPRKIQYTQEEQDKMASQPPPPPVPVQVAQINAQATVQGKQIDGQTKLAMVQQEAAHEQQLLQNGGTTPHMAQATARIEQERIRAQTAETVEASRAHAEMARADKEMQIAQQNGNFKIQELMLERELALLKYANDQKISLDQVRAQLAKSSMDNQTKRELAAAEIQLAQTEGAQDRAVDLHKHSASLVRDEVSTPVTP